MEQFSAFVEKLFLWLLKAIYYLMKVAFGLVMGTIIGLVIYLLIGKTKLGLVFLLTFAAIGLVAGIIYAYKSRKSNNSPYFNRQEL
jgi:F0F1-type ATP synthase assembly protein I